MSDLRCCVCGEALSDSESASIGSRTYCTVHHKRALAASRAHWSRFGLIETGLVAAFVGVVSIVFGAEQNALPTSTMTGVVLALVPAFLFLTYVYRQDRLEPEPIGVVLGVFLLGGLLVYGLAQPLADLLALDEWRHRSPAARLASTVLVIATIQELCKYLAVRYTVYLTDEFDEPADGVVYATAAGLGVATITNILFVVGSNGILPLAGAVAIVSTTLVHVASGAVLGYGLSRNRFGKTGGQLILAVSFLGAVLVNGLLTHAIFTMGTDGASFKPWTSLGTAVGLCAIVLVGSHLLMAQLRRQTLAGGAHG